MNLKYLLFVFLVLFTVSANNCKKQDPSSLNLTDFLDKVWLNSYEEDSAGIKAYRPDTYNLPPSRGRTGFKIMKDSTFIQYRIAPTDGWEKHPGKWRLKNNKNLMVRFNKASDRSLEWEIVRLEKDFLLLRPIVE